MEKLDVSRDEAIEILQDDEKIDKGQKLFEQTKEQKQASKKYTKVSKEVKAVNAYGKKTTVNRKADLDKRKLIEILAESLGQLEINHDVTNIEREILLNYNDRNFKIILSAPRT